MNQDDLARRIAKRLEDDLGAIPANVLDRLYAARRQALQRARSSREPAHHTGAWVARLGSRTVLARAAAAAAFAAVVGAGLLFWQANSHHDSIEVETALLADELPIHAYTDPGFHAWLRHSSHEQQ
jgi:hypothetical protein